MKRLVVLGFLVGCATSVFAAPPVAEAPIKEVGTATTVAVSSTTLTKIPTSQTSGRVGVFVDNPNGNTGFMVGHLGNCTSTVLAATIRSVEIAPSSNSSYFPIREDVCLWLITSNTGASTENLHYQEVKQ